MKKYKLLKDIINAKAFHSKIDDWKYHDADISKKINFESNWAISTINSDDLANEMHERVVEEISEKLLSWEIY